MQCEEWPLQEKDHDGADLVIFYHFLDIPLVVEAYSSIPLTPLFQLLVTEWYSSEET